MGQAGALWFALGGIVAVLMVLVLARMRARALRDLREVLVVRGDAGLYLRLLDNPRLRLLFSKAALERLRGEARTQAYGDHAKEEGHGRASR